MSADLPEMLTTSEVAALIRKSRGAVVATCNQNQGFGFKFGRAWRIPREHMKRVMSGDTPAQIAAEVRRGHQSAA